MPLPVWTFRGLLCWVSLGMSAAVAEAGTAHQHTDIAAEGIKVSAQHEAAMCAPLSLGCLSCGTRAVLRCTMLGPQRRQTRSSTATRWYRGGTGRSSNPGAAWRSRRWPRPHPQRQRLSGHEVSSSRSMPSSLDMSGRLMKQCAKCCGGWLQAASCAIEMCEHA